MIAHRARRQAFDAFGKTPAILHRAEFVPFALRTLR
jgi:hypothetical protein